MGANDVNGPGMNYLDPNREKQPDEIAGPAQSNEAAPLWRPDPAQPEAAAPAQQWAPPEAPLETWPGANAAAGNPGNWAPPPPPYQAPAVPSSTAWAQQYQNWTAAPGYGAQFASPPRQDGAIRRVGPIIVAVALLSASLSAGGTYLAIELTTKPAAAAVTSTSQPVVAQQLTLTQSDAVVRVAGLVKASVVTIESSDTGSSPFSGTSSGVGSGFLVSSNGLILTNNHVVAGATSLTVILSDARQLTATVVSTDPTHDLALVKVDATGLTPVTLGDSTAIQVGQIAIAIGSPLGTFTDSVTEGIVSGTDRSITVGDQATRSEENLTGLIQTDAAINPGNSGGPLLDAGGSVIGIVVASASSAQDMGFAIPINEAKSMIAAATK
jgi:S1-C subfamily serine protease